MLVGSFLGCRPMRDVRDRRQMIYGGLLNRPGPTNIIEHQPDEEASDPSGFADDDDVAPSDLSSIEMRNHPDAEDEGEEAEGELEGETDDSDL